MMSKGLRESLSIVPHLKKTKRLSAKVKVKLCRQNQSAEEHQIAKIPDHNQHICSRPHEKDVPNWNTAGKAK